MPKSVSNSRKFLELAARPDAKWVKVKKLKKGGTGEDQTTKFKLRTSKYLYTLVVQKTKFIDLITSSIPQSLEVIYIDQKKPE
jgi:large subunit ribosomal protein L38e